MRAVERRLLRKAAKSKSSGVGATTPRPRRRSHGMRLNFSASESSPFYVAKQRGATVYDGKSPDCQLTEAPTERGRRRETVVAAASARDAGGSRRSVPCFAQPRTAG